MIQEIKDGKKGGGDFQGMWNIFKKPWYNLRY